MKIWEYIYSGETCVWSLIPLLEQVFVFLRVSVNVIMSFNISYTVTWDKGIHRLRESVKYYIISA